jgi:D-alanyl-lipoteichoic acid acyltransferase DltB (MBOAT superfamily)
MLFNSINFLIFFPIVVGIYFLIPKKLKQLWLLVASYYFYMNWDAKYALLIFAITLLSYGGGLFLAPERWQGQTTIPKRKKSFVLLIVAVLFLLFLFKYLDFAILNVNRILSVTGFSFQIGLVSLVLPVGISFYTFQALGYLIDVYRGDTPAEKNFIKYALFVSFFPQLVAGPIERSGNLLKQLEEPKEFDYDAAKNGLLLMLWGFFEKLWVADQAAYYVNLVFSSYDWYQPAQVVVAVLLFAVQIYCDFGGYSHIAIGAAQVLGIHLMDNFRQPYLSRTVKDFWRRWHISLSTWFRDYVYIPLGGSRCSRWKKYRNLMITFLVSGLWHGASWNFVAWGGLHGFYQVIGDVTEKPRRQLRQRLHISENNWLLRLFQIFITFILCDIAWLFFRADSLKVALKIGKKVLNPVIFSQFYNRSAFLITQDRLRMRQLLLSIVVLLVVDILHENGKRIRTWLAQRHIIFRWICYLIVVVGFVLLLVQNYGEPAAQFIYFQF